MKDFEEKFEKLDIKTHELLKKFMKIMAEYDSKIDPKDHRVFMLMAATQFLANILVFADLDLDLVIPAIKKEYEYAMKNDTGPRIVSNKETN